MSKAWGFSSSFEAGTKQRGQRRLQEQPKKGLESWRISLQRTPRTGPVASLSHGRQWGARVLAEDEGGRESRNTCPNPSLQAMCPGTGLK